MRHFRNKLLRNRLTLLGILAWSLHAPVMAKPQPSKAPQTQGTAADLAPPAKPHHAKRGFRQVGRASWYGIDSTRGLRTASGERFDPDAFTGAHPSLPFGTVVKVTNLRNGRSADVRINDRGPFSGGRIIDVSYAAAAELGMMGRGTARVRIEVQPRDKPITEAQADEVAGGLP